MNKNHPQGGPIKPKKATLVKRIQTAPKNGKAYIPQVLKNESFSDKIQFDRNQYSQDDLWIDINSSNDYECQKVYYQQQVIDRRTGKKSIKTVIENRDVYQRKQQQKQLNRIGNERLAKARKGRPQAGTEIQSTLKLPTKLK